MQPASSYADVLAGLNNFLIESTSQMTAISKKTNLITANVESVNTNQSEKETGLAVRKNETIFSNTSNSPTSGRAKANHLP